MRVPARTCISVDLPAPLRPTRPMHSPALTARVAPSSARTAPKCFSTPSRATMGRPISGMDEVNHLIRLARKRRELHVRLYRGLRFLERIFVAGNAALLNGRKHGLEIVLGELEIGHQEVVRNLGVSIENLLGDPARQ